MEDTFCLILSSWTYVVGEVYSAPDPFSRHVKWETYRSLPLLSSWHAPGFPSKEAGSHEGMMCNQISSCCAIIIWPVWTARDQMVEGTMDFNNLQCTHIMWGFLTYFDFMLCLAQHVSKHKAEIAQKPLVPDMNGTLNKYMLLNTCSAMIFRQFIDTVQLASKQPHQPPQKSSGGLQNVSSTSIHHRPGINSPWIFFHLLCNNSLWYNLCDQPRLN